MLTFLLEAEFWLLYLLFVVGPSLLAMVWFWWLTRPPVQKGEE